MPWFATFPGKVRLNRCAPHLVALPVAQHSPFAFSIYVIHLRTFWLTITTKIDCGQSPTMDHLRWRIDWSFLLCHYRRWCRRCCWRFPAPILDGLLTGESLINITKRMIQLSKYQLEYLQIVVITCPTVYLQGARCQRRNPQFFGSSDAIRLANHWSIRM